MNRLDTIVSKLKGYNTLCDIGTDHGYVIKKAIDLGYVKDAIAADISIGPLNQAKSNLANYPVEFILSDGFENINIDYDVCVIAGLGGNTIYEIMKKANNLNAKYILVPNNHQPYLRERLADLGYKIIAETVVLEKNNFYFVMEVEKGTMNLTKEDMYLGLNVLPREVAKLFYQEEIKKNIDLLEKVPLEKREEIKRLITIYHQG